MTVTAPTTSLRAADRVGSAVARHPLARLAGAALAVGVAYIHVKDQGGFPGDKAPHYVGVGYYLLEITGLAVALALLVSRGKAVAASWFLALGVAVMPIVGFVLSRGPGLPGYTDDKGNWTEPLAMVSLVVEGALLLLSGLSLLRERAAALR